MEDLDRERISLTNNEKRMIIRVHQYFLNTRQCQTQRTDLPLRKEVASVLGIGEAALARVFAEHNNSKNEKFSECSERRMQGRPRKSPDHNVVDLIHRFVMTANTSGSPLSTRLLRQKLEEHGYILSKGQLLRVLHTLGSKNMKI